jgi:hypothetical protein
MINEPLTNELTADDENVMDRMMLAAIEADGPQSFDLLVDNDPEMQLVLLAWRGHLTLAARAFYRQATRAYDAAFGECCRMKPEGRLVSKFRHRGVERGRRTR